MNITDVIIRRTFSGSKMLALVSVIVDNDLAIHDIKVIQTDERLFVAMPSHRDQHGIFRDIAHPMTIEARCQIEEAILAKYHEHISDSQSVADI